VDRTVSELSQTGFSISVQHSVSLTRNLVAIYIQSLHHCLFLISHSWQIKFKPIHNFFSVHVIQVN